MHKDGYRPKARRHRAHLLVSAESPNVIDDLHASFQRYLSHCGFVRIDREEHIREFSLQAREHGQQARAFLVGAHRCSAWSGRFGA